MSFGISLGDLGLCVKLCIEICRFWNHAEQDVTDVLDKVKYTGDQLSSLQKLLCETNWEPYPFAAGLQKDLEEHKAFFKNLPALSSQTAAGQGQTAAGRFRDRAKLVTRQDALKRIKNNIEYHLARLTDFKGDVVL
jgi:hypothetical protein